MVIRDLSQQGPNNRGGAYVTDHQSEATSPSGHVLYVAGPIGAVTQVQLTDSNYVQRKWKTFRGYALDGAGSGPAPATLELLDLLHGAVTVPCGDLVDFAIVLDWNKRSVDGKLAGHTDLGDLVARGKQYVKRPSDRHELREVGRAVVGEMVEFIAQHPLLRDIDAIASVPGHDTRVLSFGSSLAFAVARDRHTRFVRCGSIQDIRAPAKHMRLVDRADALRGQFTCADDVSGQRVLIIDDLYSSGSTAQETARVLRAAGAIGVASLAAIRTMRSL